MVQYLYGGFCSACGATVLGTGGIGKDEALRMHTAFHDNMISREEAAKMSKVLWCDKGNHPFPATDEGAESVTMKKTVKDEGGNKHVEMVEMDACSLHSFSGPDPDETVPALTQDTLPYPNYGVANDR